MVRVETDIEKYESNTESRFTGTMLELLAINLGTSFLSCLTLGIATPWLECWATKWKTEHTFINGKKMCFDGVGSELFFEYIKWWLLGVLTLGIYSLWIPVKLEQWMVKHICFESSHDRESRFTGGMLGYWGVELTTMVLSILTLGIAYPWLLSWQASWYRSHTCISGEQLYFDGQGAQLFGKWLQWGLLMILTLGIYGLWIPVKEQQWIVKHTYTGRVAPVHSDEPGPIEVVVNRISGKKTAADGWICTSCGHCNPTGTGFCVSCSKPRNADEPVEPAVCLKCGNQMPECVCNSSGGLWKKCPDCGKLYKGNKCTNCKAPEFFVCARCGRRPVTVRGDICSECSKKKCENCGNLYVGTKCPYCQANPMCSRCGRRPVTREGEICDTCERRATSVGFFPPDDL